MNTKTFSQLESMLHLGETLISVEENRLSGEKGYSIDDVDEMMKKVIMETTNEQFK